MMGGSPKTANLMTGEACIITQNFNTHSTLEWTKCLNEN